MHTHQQFKTQQLLSFVEFFVEFILFIKLRNESFRNTSKKLYKTMDTIVEERDGFSQAKTRNIHNCVGSFSKRGFKGHPPLPPGMPRYVHKKQEITNLQRKFKIAHV